MEEAKIQSTQSSNGLEGIVTTQKRLKAIMAYSAKPNSRAEEEIAGYRDALSLIHEQHDFIPVTPSVILQLHRDSWHTQQSRMGAIGKIAITKSSPSTIKAIDLCALGRLRPWQPPDLSKKPVGPSMMPYLVKFATPSLYHCASSSILSAFIPSTMAMVG